MNTSNTHVTDGPCPACELLKLGIILARREKPEDVARCEARLKAHLAGRLVGDQMRLDEREEVRG